jgi:small-conductance mechanosensitive channel
MIGGLVSRPVSPEGEIWFPCEEGDWIDLPGTGKARVIAQTPETVQVVKLGGSTVTFPTARFLETGLVNLSPGFRIFVRIGVGYRHLAEATGAIPETLRTRLERELNALVGERGLLRSLKVEFAAASSSSLDFAIIADFDGSLASRYDVLERAIHRVAVDCCRDHGWEIPFPQIVVHRAGDASA